MYVFQIGGHKSLPFFLSRLGLEAVTHYPNPWVQTPLRRSLVLQHLRQDRVRFQASTLLSHLPLTTWLTSCQDPARWWAFQLGLHSRSAMVQKLSQLHGRMVDRNHMAILGRCRFIRRWDVGARNLDIELPNIPISALARHTAILRCPHLRLGYQHVPGSIPSSNRITDAAIPYFRISRIANPSHLSSASSAGRSSLHKFPK